jgi:hypothetical protein
VNRNRERRGHGRPEAPEEGFAGRWSRMKRGARTAPAAAPEVEAPPRADERSDEEILRELGLPDPETLRPGDDIKGFMVGAVPARIRNRVLRRLWISNPVLANLDGLVDYGEDFTDAAMVPAVLQTAYKVGRGWARDAVEEEPEKTSAAEKREADEKEPDAVASDAPRADTSEPAPATPTDAGAELPGGQERGHEGAGEDNVEASAHPGAEAGELSSPNRRAARGADRRAAPRRMKFRFAED